MILLQIYRSYGAVTAAESKNDRVTGQALYLKLSEVMKQLGFIKVRSEPCVYVFDRQGDKVIVPTYVDDLHITAKTTDAIQ